MEIGSAVQHITANVSTAVTMEGFGFTLTEIMKSGVARIDAGGAIRYTEDGTAPGASDGMAIGANGTRLIFGAQNVRNLRVVSQSGTVSVSITLYKDAKVA